MQIYVKVSMKPTANILFRLLAKFRSVSINPRIKNYKNIPIIINNYNRLNYLKEMIKWFEDAGYRNIYIIDNNSTYQPLLDFYKKSRHTVFRLSKNVRQLALWKTHVFQYFHNTFYVYTDPDILPIEDCPQDVLLHFKNILERHQDIDKVGFGLKIDDLPDCYSLKNQVLKWESQYWENEVEKNLYDAKIDTTFALYRPNIKGDWELKAYRTAGAYLSRHLPWYIDSKNISEEEKFFQENTTSASSWYQKNKYN